MRGRKAFATGLALAACMAFGPATALAAHTDIYGGPALKAPSEAPWSVLTNEDDGSGTSGVGCSGTIIDATHVITAAHCTFDSSLQPFPGADYHVYAGVVSDEGGSELQERTVTSERIGPGYVPPNGGSGDVAVLTLNKAFDLSKPGVKAIPVVGENAPLFAGTQVGIAGWGQVTEGTADGHEHSLVETVGLQRDCLGGQAAILCGSSPTGATCHGDSGSGITTGSPPVLVGVTSVGVGTTICVPLSPTGFVYLGTPEISQWLRGNNAPPLAPRTTTSALIGNPAPVGQKVKCLPPTWADATSLATVFFRADTDQNLQVGPSATFTPGKALLNVQIGCASIATGPGGVTESLRSGNATVTPAPPKRRKQHKRRSSELVRPLTITRKHGRWKVKLAFKPLLVGGFAGFEWKATGCRHGCGVAKRAKIARQRLTLTSPPAGGRGKLLLALPSVKTAGASYAPSRIVIRLGRH